MVLQKKRKYFPVVISSYVFFERSSKILLSRRYNTGYRDGEYSLPAGHIEKAEFATTAAIREAKEEVNVTIQPKDLIPAHIMHRHCGDHERIDFFFCVKKWTGKITNSEPNRCDNLEWFSFDELPENVIPYIRVAVDNYRKGNFFSEFNEVDNKVFNK